MVQKVDMEEFDKLRIDQPIIDVRSPKEHAHGHIPSAISLPVFSDEERTIVGTLYKKKGREEAMEKAMEFVEPKRSEMLLKVKDICGDTNNQLLVHCWRGGMRSANFGGFLAENGVGVNLLEGGYKAYRNSIINGLRKPWKVIVLGGMTGTGKTEILDELKKRGHQTICLEGIAKHRGSAFGSLGQEGQPTTEQFQNNLWEEWSTLDISRPVIVEDESQAIGSVRIPDELFADMRRSPVIKLELDLEHRAKRLVEEYGKFEISALKKSVENISRRLGHKRTAQAIEDLDNGNLLDVAISTLRYYDKAYTFGLEKRDQGLVNSVEIKSGDAQANAEIVERSMELIEEKLWKK